MRRGWWRREVGGARGVVDDVFKGWAVDVFGEFGAGDTITESKFVSIILLIDVSKQRSKERH